MQKATRMLNLLSAMIMFAAGVYIHLTFSAVLTSAALVLLWTIIVFYALMQVEFGYGVIRKHIHELMH